MNIYIYIYIRSGKKFPSWNCIMKFLLNYTTFISVTRIAIALHNKRKKRKCNVLCKCFCVCVSCFLVFQNRFICNPLRTGVHWRVVRA